MCIRDRVNDHRTVAAQQWIKNSWKVVNEDSRTRATTDFVKQVWGKFKSEVNHYIESSKESPKTTQSKPSVLTQKGSTLRPQERQEQVYETAQPKAPVAKPGYCQNDGLNEVARALKAEGVQYLYHFTKAQNLPSILKTGLLSRDILQNNGYNARGFGGSDFSYELDKRNGTSDYVHLSFCTDHPMQYRLLEAGEDLVLLKIDASIVNNDTYFSDINAANSEATIRKGLEGFALVNVAATRRQYVSRMDSDFGAHQAEALVPKRVPASAIVSYHELKH